MTRSETAPPRLAPGWEDRLLDPISREIPVGAKTARELYAKYLASVSRHLTVRPMTWNGFRFRLANSPVMESAERFVDKKWRKVYWPKPEKEEASAAPKGNGRRRPVQAD